MDERRLLSNVTIVGMKFYKGSHEYLEKAGQVNPDEAENQCLYLVAEVGNPYDSNAVMLHNGKQKLGSVSSEQTKAICDLLRKWSAESKSDDIVVMKFYQAFPRIGNTSAVNLTGTYRLNERLARKFSDKHRKE